MAPTSRTYYAFRTIRRCVEWIAEQESAIDQRQEICHTLSRSAILHGGRPLRAAVRLNPYTDYQSREGLRQTDQAPEHLLAAAARVGSTSLVQRLLDQGADVNGESDLFGTPLVNAARGGHLLLVRLLLEKGADSDCASLELTEQEIGDELFLDDFPGRLNSMSPIKEERAPFSPLSAAAFAGHMEIVQLLLSPQLRLSRSSCYFFQALSLAAEGGHSSILQILLASADLDAVDHRLSRQVKIDALKRAASEGQVDCMELLLDAGAPITRMTFSTLTESTLTCAATRGQNGAIKLLLDRGAHVDEMGTHRDTPLSRAVELGFPRTVALLLSHGVDPNVHAVEAFCRCDIWCCMKALLDGGFHKVCPWASKTALSRTEQEGAEDLVALLQEYGVTTDGLEGLKPP
ncbi:hypothetical protein ASPVEDRAFT_45425 [Aspergillus versicolor CBS 583.65]|uniref:Uncharacterized protein n=1 Tax=Aspergillus versicolor CBS 583.65 TaxID=1036611 RepID=A0A1L9PWS8_ASPVE|nr:uncharacterized protein ASPVEDRAFT_45425 [Aspergillus versicolor CBS 583.65]OJJ06000.1 hypothetical protein ASPVEDRAFT_45425 [Aspergillus versicolor CBS 583.65]